MRNRLFPVRFLAFVFVLVQCVMAPAVQASMIGTDEMLADETRTEQRERILDSLDRESAGIALERFGVAPADVEQRLERLSDRELTQLAARADELPAGESALGVLVFVLVLLIVLDLLGATNVFPAINSLE